LCDHNPFTGHVHRPEAPISRLASHPTRFFRPHDSSLVMHICA